MIEAALGRSASHTHDTPAGPSGLRARGRRLTRQRALIWETFAAEPEQHFSADDVVEHVRSSLPHVNASTMYRTLDLLVAEGLLLRTDLGAGRSYYEAAHEHAHHHLVCERCGAVQHFHDDVLGELPKRIRAATGYELGAAEMTLYGVCSSCREAGGRQAARG